MTDSFKFSHFFRSLAKRNFFLHRVIRAAFFVVILYLADPISLTAYIAYIGFAPTSNLILFGTKKSWSVIGT